MAEKINLLIVGAGRGGTALIEMLSHDRLVNILGVVDPDPEAPGIKLAKENGIHTATDWKKVLKDKSLDEIIDVTGNPEVFEALNEEKPKSVDIMGGPTARMMWLLFEERKRSKEYAEKLFHCTPSAVFTVDKDKRVTSWNKRAEELTGYKADEVIGEICRLFSEAPCYEECGLFNENLKKPLTNRECSIKRKDGAIRHISKNVDELRDEKGQLIGGVESFEDVTDIIEKEKKLKEAKEELEKKTKGLEKSNEAINLLYDELVKKNRELLKIDQMKSDFVSQVSHELRTPLTAIKEGIGIVLDGSAGEINDEQKMFLDTASRNIARLTRLINDVLDLQKLEAGRMEFKITKNDINGIIVEIRDIMISLAKEKGLEIITDLDEALPMIRADRDKIVQVLTNLVNNAIKFTEKGSITLSAARKGESIEVSVKDTGPGIKKEDISRLFRKFEQLEGSYKKRTGGTGLGLAISREIVERHKGRIWAESESGKGTAFKFTLPIEGVSKVLIIDDDKEFQSFCKDLLQKHEYRVSQASSGMDGIQAAQKDHPDIIVLDMKLPDINGFEVIGRLRSDKDLRSIPVLVISGYMDELAEMERLGKTDTRFMLPKLVKPFDVKDFLDTVRKLIVS